jgi:hypothetical protein
MLNFLIQFFETYECWSCFHVEGERLFLWTATTNGPIVHRPGNVWEWRATVEWYWQGKAEELGEKPVPVPLCPPQISQRTRASAARYRRLTAWHMALSNIIVTTLYIQNHEFQFFVQILIFLKKLNRIQIKSNHCLRDTSRHNQTNSGDCSYYYSLYTAICVNNSNIVL